MPAEILRIRPCVAQAPQFFQMHIGDFGGAQGARKLLTVELRIVAGARDGTNIYYTLNAVCLQDREEFLQRSVRVPDRETPLEAYFCVEWARFGARYNYKYRLWARGKN